MREKLLGALIGLARSTANASPIESTYAVIWKGLRAYADSTSTSNDLEELYKEVRNEKFILVPDCRYCASPCGNTSDYDTSLFEEETPSNKIKKQIIQLLCEITEAADTIGDGDIREYVIRALAVISFDWGCDDLEQLLNEGKQWKK